MSTTVSTYLARLVMFTLGWFVQRLMHLCDHCQFWSISREDATIFCSFDPHFSFGSHSPQPKLSQPDNHICIKLFVGPTVPDKPQPKRDSFQVALLPRSSRRKKDQKRLAVEVEFVPTPVATKTNNNDTNSRQGSNGTRKQLNEVERQTGRKVLPRVDSAPTDNEVTLSAF